jgi:hypothetical protein
VDSRESLRLVEARRKIYFNIETVQNKTPREQIGNPARLLLDVWCWSGWLVVVATLNDLHGRKLTKCDSLR